jgi:hypothetical protein
VAHGGDIQKDLIPREGNRRGEHPLRQGWNRAAQPRRISMTRSTRALSSDTTTKPFAPELRQMRRVSRGVKRWRQLVQSPTARIHHESGFPQARCVRTTWMRTTCPRARSLRSATIAVNAGAVRALHTRTLLLRTGCFTHMSVGTFCQRCGWPFTRQRLISARY